MSPSDPSTPWRAHLLPGDRYDPAADGAETCVRVWQRHVDSRPEEPCLLDPSGRSLTWKQFDHESRKKAGHLAAAGIRTGQRVLCANESSLESVLAHAACLRLGAVVPSNRAVMRCRAPVMDAVSEMPVSLDALSEIQQTVAGQAVVLFSKSRCAESKQCKSILDSMEQPYTTMDLDLSDDGEAFEAALLSLTPTPRLASPRSAAACCPAWLA